MVAIAPPVATWNAWRLSWSRIGLAQRYALASFPVLLLLTAGLGWWVTRAIELQVLENTGANVALYVQSFLAPELQGLKDRDYLSAQEMSSLESLMGKTPLGKKIRAVKIWKEGGKIVYYSRRRLIGERFEETDNLKRAWAGEVATEFADLTDAEDVEEAKLGIPLLEVYSPLLARGRDKVIAVVEFYQNAELVEQHLRQTRWRTWAVVIAAVLGTYGLLFGIVNAGGRTIRRQREELGHRVAQLSDLLEHNEALTARVRRAARRTTEINEQFLNRLSADLHDGPAQSMSLALLRLDGTAAGDAQKAAETTGEVRDAIAEALTEIRQISRGLALPELDRLDAKETLERVVRSHCRRTETEVELDLADLDPTVPIGRSVKLALFRVVQEALMNAYRHAGGRGQRVAARNDVDGLHVTIGDEGQGFEPADVESSRTDRLGLPGLRERVESRGGGFSLDASPGYGTTVRGTRPAAVVR